MDLESNPKCYEDGCTNEANWYTIDFGEGETVSHYALCDKHATKYGFCYSCREFWGGIESFEFGLGSKLGLCENCYDATDWDDDDDDDDDYYDYEDDD